MTTMNDFNYVDLLDDHHADHVNVLMATAFRAEYSNTETITATKELNNADTPTQIITASGADRTVELAPEDSSNHITLIYNAGGSNNVVVKDDSGATTFATLAPGEFVLCYPILGVAWKVIVQPVVKSWSPTPTNLTLGSGTMVGKYIQQGQRVAFTLTISFAADTTISGGVTFPLPVTAITHSLNMPIGLARFRDASLGFGHQGVVQQQQGTSTIAALIYDASATYLSASNLSSTVPFTWATSDEFSLSGSYFAA